MRKHIDYEILQEQEQHLTQHLESIREEALKRVSQILGERATVYSFHGKIGCNNTTFVDSLRLQFSDPDHFLGLWTKGLMDRVEAIEAEQRKKYRGNIYQNTLEHKLLRLLKDPLVREYTFIFLVRNFYRQFDARTRAKPDQILWSLWFGDSYKLVWGLIIAPIYRDNRWANDKSEIRRASYSYWTVGHLMETGLIDPSSRSPVRFSTVDEFITFYKSVLKRLSNPIYEQGIAERYIDYLSRSSNIYEEPFLIPELRYAGLEEPHKYRLDYTVLNSHIMKSVGFELSPASTHSSISSSTKKTQREINEDLSKQWAKEMRKRNEYFSEFGISTITFTDDDLRDLDKCFSMIAQYLSERSTDSVHIVNEVARIDEFRFQ